MASPNTNDDLPEMMKEPTFMLGFIGAGNMAQAIIGSLVKAGTVRADQVVVSAPSDTRLAPLRQQGITTTHDNTSLVKTCDVVLLCVKPHIFKDVAAEISIPQFKTKLFISVMAGLTLDYLRTSLRFPDIIRAMPNTPCLVGEGCCVYCLPSHMSPSIAAVGRRVLSCLGLVREIPERLVDAAAAVAGSGPAYLYLIIEALADGGVQMGLPRELAMALSAQTVRGAATLVQQTGRHPAQLKDEVCSPGGTTIVGMHALEQGGVRASLMTAVKSATARAGELLEDQKRKDKEAME